MGKMFQSTSKTSSTGTSDSQVSDFQKPFLQTAFNGAQDLFKQKSGSAAYGGERYAGMDGQAQQTLDALRKYSTGAGMGAASRIGQAGSTLLDGAAEGAHGSADAYARMAGTDATAGNIAAARAYANNPEIDGMVTAATRDVTRNLNEGTLPGIDRQATASGNINSSRAGVAAGIAQRGAADSIADVSANIRGQAYDRGLSLAEQARGTNLSAMGNSAGIFGNQVSQGAGTIGAGLDATYGNYDEATKAAALGQADRQGYDTAAKSQWDENDVRQQKLLDAYYGTIGANQWGQKVNTTGTEKATKNPGLVGGLLGAASTAAGIYGGFK
ncbi:hypothetical protein EUV02_03940 [Polymorphobacter arshaanensis]|uniref:Uncharacterized protein n=1 Tax=Glacieibacterium arshaanense TaxID=2511025 RepID=A0A4Y9ERT7_9SPHN|nr:hypothetical protein [Polymorphobacter arshaanensis]TFU06172.1 hypothetical protein EUV02_03940 [Polymorphobacter arshaanensis]